MTLVTGVSGNLNRGFSARFAVVDEDFGGPKGNGRAFNRSDEREPYLVVADTALRKEHAGSQNGLVHQAMGVMLDSINASL